MSFGMAPAATAANPIEINGTRLEGVPTPYGLLTRVLPALKIVRQANRFNVMAGLSLAVLAGIAWADLAPRLSSLSWPLGWPRPAKAGEKPREEQDADRVASSPPRVLRPNASVGGGLRGGSWLATGIMAVLLLFDYWSTPCPTQPGAVSPFYEQLAAEPDDAVAVAIRVSMPLTVPSRRLVVRSGCWISGRPRWTCTSCCSRKWWTASSRRPGAVHSGPRNNGKSTLY